MRAKKVKKYEGLLSKIRDLIRLMTKNSNGYDERYMIIKFKSHDKLPLNKTTEIPSMVIFAKIIIIWK